MPRFGDRCLSQLELAHSCLAIQNAFVRHLLGLVVVNRKLGDKCIEVRCGSPSAETGQECADGPVTKGASEISNPFQGADYSLFRFLRSQPVGTVVSVRTRGDQHNNCRFLHSVLSTRLAVLVRNRCGRLFTNLSRLALAQRCARYRFLGIGESLLLLALSELIWRVVGRKLVPQLSARHPSLVADLSGRSPRRT